MSEQTLSAARRPLPGLFGLNAPSGCAGVPIAGVEIKILRPDGTHAAIDEPGELWTKGHNTALGYYNNPKATAETFIDGWLRTGDSFKVDKNGLMLSVDCLPFPFAICLFTHGAIASSTAQKTRSKSPVHKSPPRRSKTQSETTPTNSCPTSASPVSPAGVRQTKRSRARGSCSARRASAAGQKRPSRRSMRGSGRV